jgi:tRNA(fMet)-specific endonuclease VapC
MAADPAKLKQALSTAGRPIPENDIWIAATASSHGLPLYCRDAHFDELAGLMTIIQA